MINKKIKDILLLKIKLKDIWKKLQYSETKIVSKTTKPEFEELIQNLKTQIEISLKTKCNNQILSKSILNNLISK